MKGPSGRRPSPRRHRLAHEPEPQPRIQEGHTMRSRPCAVCLARGIRTPAERIMRDGSGLCGSCYRGVRS